MFEEMLFSINYEITKILTRIKINNSNKSNIRNNITKSPNMNSNKKSNDPRCLLNSKNIDIPRNKKKSSYEYEIQTMLWEKNDG
ncbi:MAG: hypothetical protein Ct9H90mP3_8670 [Flammeovirgaceae bacterium]|nr:MAG: hypothetical protein Ct9H90mP3_8670 [Flammeovirgaceae bacterium]